MADNVKVIKIDTQPAQRSVKDLKNELKSLKDTMLSCEQGTEEYNQALTQAAEIQHELKEQMEQVNAVAMDFGQIASNSTKAMGGIIGGFQAATAAMNLFGIENEDVLKSMQKMQQIMAMTQALPAIDKGIKAFKALGIAIKTTAKSTSAWGKALIGTGIGAIVVALGLLIANFDKISQWLDELTGQTDFLGTVADNVIGGLEAGWAAVIQSLKAVGNAIVTYVTTPFKAVWNAIQAYTSTDGSFAQKLKAAGSAMKNGFVSDWQKVGDDFKQVGTAAASAFQQGVEKHRQKRLAKNVENAVEDGKIEGKAKGEAKAQAEEAAYKKTLKSIDKSEREEMLKLQALGLSYEEYVKRKEELEDEFTKKRIEAIQTILAGMKEEEEGYVELQEQLISLQDSLYKKPEKESKPEDEPKSEGVTQAEAINAALETTKSALQEVSDNPAWANIIGNIQNIINIFDDLNKNHIEKGSKEAMNAYMQVAAVGLGAVGQMMNGLAAEQDASNKEGFESAKKYQIAGATMTTLSSVLQALAAGNSMASQMGLAAPVGWALGAAMAAMVGAMGAANIAKIAKQKFGGSGSSTSGSISTPSTSAVSSVIAPVQYTQDVQGSAIEGAIKDSKVYVVESDITDTQEKVHVSESEARY